MNNLLTTDYAIYSPKDSSVVSCSRLRLFAGMSTDEVSEVVRHIGNGVRHYRKGETIVHEGTKARWLIPVLSGVVSVYEPGANGERHLVRTLESGQLFGATLVTTRQEYYPGMAVAARDCDVMFYDMEKIRNLWCDARYKRFFENLYAAVSDYVLYCWRKFWIMACKTTDEKFMLYLNWYASEVGSTDLTLPFARMEDCATFLGVTRAALSPAIGRLVDCGEIGHPSRSRFILLNPRRCS